MARRRRKRRMTKKRFKRILRAYFFRFLFVLILLAIGFGVYTAGKFLFHKASDVFQAMKERADQMDQQAEAPSEGIVVETDMDGSGAAQAQTEKETEPPSVVATLKLTATGDCTLAKTQTQDYENSFYEFYDSYGPDWFFQGVRDIFEKDDLTLINLECVLTESDQKIDKPYNLKGKPEYTKILTGSSVEVATLGNNHLEDYGEQGIIDTKNNLDQAGITWAVDDDLGYYTTEDGIKVGVLSRMNIVFTEEREQKMLDDVERLKSQGCNLIVATVHWGIEKAHYPESNQISTAHKLIDAGVDLIIGNHSHVLQGVEVYKGKVICYSLGNFCFGGNRNPEDKNTMLYQQTFTFVDGVVQPDLDASIIPCTISSEMGYNDFQPTLAEPERKQAIIDKVNEYSSNLSKIHFDERGFLWLDQPEPAEGEAGEEE